MNNGLNILIVEDEDDNYLIISEFIKIFKHKPLRAKNGREAVDIIKSNNEINLVLMDIRLPDISGFDATILIKEIKPDMPIIAQTAYSSANDMYIAQKAGVDDYITKPIDIDILQRKILKWAK